MQSAWSATRKKDTFLYATYQSLVRRMGRKKAQIAISRKILEAVYIMLKYKVPYKELGAEFVAERKRESRIKYLKRELEKYDYTVVPQVA